MDDYNLKQVLKELEQKKIETKKRFDDTLSDEAYGRWKAFQEAQDIINKYK
jgi:hypothetical protein